MHPSRHVPTAAPRRALTSPQGFTLLEMLGVLAVILIIAGVILGIVPGAMRIGNIDQAEAELQVIQHALEKYRARFGDYPRPPGEYVDEDNGNIFGVDDSAEYLLNALNGRFGPAGDAIDIPSMLNNSALRFEKPDLPLNSVRHNRIIDPWGQPYVYKYKSAAATSSTPFGYQMYSLGPDKAEGGARDRDNVNAR